MKSEFTFFTKEAIVQFLGNYGKEKTKDYEFGAALVMHHSYEKQWGGNFWIGIRIKPEYLNILPAYNTQREVILGEVKDLLRKGNDEDSHIDFVVARQASIQKAQGTTFQVKRFGIGRNKKDTNELVTYLNSFHKKYPKTDANLLICLDDWVNIDMEKFYTNFNTEKFSFNKLLFMWFDNNTVYLRDVYPRGNTMCYPKNEIIEFI